jgi:hypothetical protein
MGLALLLGGPIQHMLFEVDAHDPFIFGGVAGTLRSWAWVACLFPACALG